MEMIDFDYRCWMCWGTHHSYGCANGTASGDACDASGGSDGGDGGGGASSGPEPNTTKALHFWH